MPELPEVETVCRVMRRALQGKRIAKVDVENDSIVFKGAPKPFLVEALEGRVLTGVGRKGKTWWLETDAEPVVYGHLGMSGWIRELGMPTTRLIEHGNAPLDDESGRPRFLKLMLHAEDGARVALTDGRRLARVWLGGPAAEEKKLAELGPDMRDEPWQVERLAPILAKRKAPIKAMLLDQKLFCGVGNWIADEVLFQAGIAPARAASSLSENEVAKLVHMLGVILGVSVDAEADAERYPDGWLFPHRWGGARGSSHVLGHEIVRETIGGRTTAWVPDLQR